MKIKVTVPIATPGLCYVPGTEYEMHDAEADRLIAAGQATAVDPNYKPAAKPVTMDQKAGHTAETIGAVKAPAVATVHATVPDPAAGLTAVDLAKKAAK